MDQEKIVHVADVQMDVQLLLDEMVKAIQGADAGNLNHLASRIISLVSRILMMKHIQHPLKR